MSEKVIACMACDRTPFLCECEDGPTLSLPRAMTLLASEREGWRYADELEQERKRLTAELEALRADADRLDWYFGQTPKDGAFLGTYMLGMREGWTPDQWRAAIDEARKGAA